MSSRPGALRGTVPAARASAAVALLAWCAIAAVIAVTVGAASFSWPQGTVASGTPSDPPSALALREIPREFLTRYMRAASTYGVDWAVVAAIGKVECDHGRAPDRSCSRVGATNVAGAGGPMQFLGSTWIRYGTDANDDGSASRWDPADAIYSAAAYLAASGASRDVGRAIFAYNHASWYVADVERWAARYRRAPNEVAGLLADGTAGTIGLAQETETPVVYTDGGRARLAPGDGHVALIPARAPPAVQAMVVAGNELQDLPYGPAGHPDPRGAPSADCSSSVSYVLYRAGVRPITEVVRDNPLAQAYVSWGAPGRGRWVTIYATQAPLPHVFIVVAGLRLDTSHNGTDMGPNRVEGGPRWRVFDAIPTWAHWSVRHPPGL